jgi:hypothetical protein
MMVLTIEASNWCEGAPPSYKKHQPDHPLDCPRPRHESCTSKHHAREKIVNFGVIFVKNAEHVKITTLHDTIAVRCDMLPAIPDEG